MNRSRVGTVVGMTMCAALMGCDEAALPDGMPTGEGTPDLEASEGETAQPSAQGGADETTDAIASATDAEDAAVERADTPVTATDPQPDAGTSSPQPGPDILPCHSASRRPSRTTPPIAAWR